MSQEQQEPRREAPEGLTVDQILTRLRALQTPASQIERALSETAAELQRTLSETETVFLGTSFEAAVALALAELAQDLSPLVASSEVFAKLGRDLSTAQEAVLAAQQTMTNSITPNREAVIAKAIEVIGDEQAAMRWMGTPVRALDYATPISRLADQQGQADVLRVLTQLEHGVL